MPWVAKSSRPNGPVKRIEEEVGRERVICALSGGVDSTVAAALVHKAIGERLACIFVDNGLLRKNEAKQVEKMFRDKFKLNLVCVDAGERFLKKLEDLVLELKLKGKL